MKINITPVAKPRMTRADKWKQRPAVMKYRAFCDELRLKHPQTVPERLSCVFYVQMPNSWSEKKKAAMDGLPHQQRPDIDNYLKAVLDALCEEDSYVWDVATKKLWSRQPAIDISEKSV